MKIIIYWSWGTIPGSAEAGVMGVIGAGVAGFWIGCMAEDDELMDVKEGILWCTYTNNFISKRKYYL